MTILIRDFSIDGSRARVECRVIHNGIDDRGKPQATGRNETLNSSGRAGRGFGSVEPDTNPRSFRRCS